MVDRDDTPNYTFRIQLDSTDCCSDIREIVEGVNLGAWSARKRDLLYITLVECERVDEFCPGGYDNPAPLKVSTISDVNELSAKLFDKSLVGRIIYVTMHPVMHNKFTMTIDVSESDTTNITSETIEYLVGLLSWRTEGR